jgi:hypothetical protein
LKTVSQSPTHYHEGLKKKIFLFYLRNSRLLVSDFDSSHRTKQGSCENPFCLASQICLQFTLVPILSHSHTKMIPAQCPNHYSSLHSSLSFRLFSLTLMYLYKHCQSFKAQIKFYFLIQYFQLGNSPFFWCYAIQLKFIFTSSLCFISLSTRIAS